MRDRRREQRNRRVPAELSRQDEIAQPQRQNLGVVTRRAPSSDRKLHRGGARARGRRQRSFRALARRPQGVPASASRSRSRGRSSRSAAARSVGRRAEPARSGETAPQPMDAAGGAGGRVPAGVGRKMFGVAQRGRILARRASAAQAVAARKARRWRSAPANGGSARRIWSSRASPAPARKAASTPASAPTAGSFGGRAQDGNACSNSGLVGAKRGAARRRDRRWAGRPAPGRADRRREFRHRGRRRARIGPWP